MVRFTSLEDYEFVMTQGPWMIGDSYLTIHKWVPNFIQDEEPIKTLTAWVQIPNLSVEYFDREFLHRIGAKIGRVVRIDKNTESMDRGQYIRFCIEVSLAKPLLSKFRLNGRVWRIQYEGLRQIFFKCGHLGHKDTDCPKFRDTTTLEATETQGQGEKQSTMSEKTTKVQRPEEKDQYGTWMLVQKPPRRTHDKPKGTLTKHTEPQGQGGSTAKNGVGNQKISKEKNQEQY